MTRADLIIRNAAGGTSIAIKAGRIVALSAEGWHAPELDAAGATILPGLHDHHLHLFATAAARQSVNLAGLTGEPEVVSALRAAPATHGWVRATGFDERLIGLPDADQLERWLPGTPLRIKDRTGALWLLSRSAFATIGSGPWPDCVELDGSGHPTGRIWRGDDWLRASIGGDAPDLKLLGAEMARYGITAVTDAGARNGPADAAALIASGIPQRLTIMGDETLTAGDGFTLGPLKLLIDERDPPMVEALAARISAGRAQGRAIAAHCVTALELALYIAALDEAGGALPGDRVEHGGVINPAMIHEIAVRGLIVVTQPGFVQARGDRYLREVPLQDQSDLWRLGSLLAADIAVRGGSDAPYGPLDPWVAIEAGMTRQTESGAVLGPDERVSFDQALALYAGPALAVGGAAADVVLYSEGAVRATVIGGVVVFGA